MPCVAHQFDPVANRKGRGAVQLLDFAGRHLSSGCSLRLKMGNKDLISLLKITVAEKSGDRKNACSYPFTPFRKANAAA